MGDSQSKKTQDESSLSESSLSKSQTSASIEVSDESSSSKSQSSPSVKYSSVKSSSSKSLTSSSIEKSQTLPSVEKSFSSKPTISSVEYPSEKPLQNLLVEHSSKKSSVKHSSNKLSVKHSSTKLSQNSISESKTLPESSKLKTLKYPSRSSESKTLPESSKLKTPKYPSRSSESKTQPRNLSESLEYRTSSSGSFELELRENDIVNNSKSEHFNKPNLVPNDSIQQINHRIQKKHTFINDFPIKEKENLIFTLESQLNSHITLFARIGSDSKYGEAFQYCLVNNKQLSFAMKSIPLPIDYKINQNNTPAHKEKKILDLLSILVENRVSPNLPIIYGSAICFKYILKNQKLKLEQIQLRTLKKQKEKNEKLQIEQKDLESQKEQEDANEFPVMLIFNELANCDVNKHLPYLTSIKKVNNMIFQVTISLYTIPKYLGLCHMDLHLGNVLVHLLPLPYMGFWDYIIPLSNNNTITFHCPNLGFLYVLWDFGMSKCYQHILDGNGKSLFLDNLKKQKTEKTIEQEKKKQVYNYDILTFLSKLEQSIDEEYETIYKHIHKIYKDVVDNRWDYLDLLMSDYFEEYREKQEIIGNLIEQFDITQYSLPPFLNENKFNETNFKLFFE